MLKTKNPIRDVITNLSKIPGIGTKSAQRISFWLLKRDEKYISELLSSIHNLKSKLIYCSNCNNITENDPCNICIDEKRDRSKICVIEEPFNILSFEKTGQFFGLYHVLHGNLSPLKGIGPEELRIQNLKSRLGKETTVKEVIIATSPTTEGNATAHYLYELLKNEEIKITRIALGLPIGSDIDYVDSVTISKALIDRNEIK